MSGADLTGTWDGIFNYPRTLPPTAFIVELRQSGDVLAGEIAEPDADGGTLRGWLEGTRSGDTVRFVKAYDDPARAHYTIVYTGNLDAEATEISGRWEITNDWAGTFIMTRRPLPAETAEIATAEEVVTPAEAR